MYVKSREKHKLGLDATAIRKSLCIKCTLNVVGAET
jgi:hypothetical protein